MFDDKITVLIPTSPIPSHPSTDIIDRVLKAIRVLLPDARIVIMADGVRPEVWHRKQQYEDYLKVMSDKLARMEYGNTCMAISTEFSQQAIMTRKAIESGLVKTPYILFVEHDCRIHEDIKLSPIVHLLDTGTIDMVRFYHWGRIWHEHEHLMQEHFMFEDMEFVKTNQYSQWPNIGRTDYYQRLLTDYFAPNKRAMIEPVVYGPVNRGPWDKHRIVIYYPPEANTFDHLNGRFIDESGRRDPNTEIYP